MGLFDKKFCSVCGQKIGLFGNRKLEDGNLCKECASKLSYWFSERRQATVEQIKEQLAYREENLEKVKAFHTTKTLGRANLICFDENAKRFMVQRTKNALTENPDVIDYSAVTGVDIDVDEDKDEIMTEDAEGKKVSYNPPRYEYGYNFTAIIRVNHPYFSEMEVKLNPSTVSIEQVTIPGKPSIAPVRHPEYMQYEKMGKEIKETLTAVQEAAAEEARPKRPVKCPLCGAITVPDENGKCEYCGSVIE